MLTVLTACKELLLKEKRLAELNALGLLDDVISEIDQMIYDILHLDHNQVNLLDTRSHAAKLAWSELRAHLPTPGQYFQIFVLADVRQQLIICAKQSWVNSAQDRLKTLIARAEDTTKEARQFLRECQVKKYANSNLPFFTAKVLAFTCLLSQRGAKMND